MCGGRFGAEVGHRSSSSWLNEMNTKRGSNGLLSESSRVGFYRLESVHNRHFWPYPLQPCNRERSIPGFGADFLDTRITCHNPARAVAQETRSCRSGTTSHYGRHSALFQVRLSRGICREGQRWMGLGGDKRQSIPVVGGEGSLWPCCLR